MRVAVLATRNSAKLRELQQLTRGWGVRWLTLRDFPWIPPVVEDGRTFAANARTKALSVARCTGLVTVADDSGLAVDALRGAPGVRSARFAGPPRPFAKGRGPRTTDAANNRKLLRLLRRVPPARRSAHFRCCIAVADGRGRVATIEGQVRGCIVDRPRGRTGFGYDPLFLILRYRRTLAELGPRVKHRISHRAQALRNARPLIARWLTVASG